MESRSVESASNRVTPIVPNVRSIVMNRQQRRAEKRQARSGAPAASPAIQSTLADALRHHQAGRLNEAERLYRQNLALDPRHADSLHLLGMVAYQSGRHDVAAELIGQAIGVNAMPAYYH